MESKHFILSLQLTYLFHCTALHCASRLLLFTAGIARISRPVGSKDSAPPSPDRKISSRGPSNGTSTGKKISNGSTSGSVTGEKSAVGDKNRDRRRNSERREGDRKDGDRPIRGPGGEREKRERGGRERDPASKVCRNLTQHCVTVS